jgi:hypothetical protein
MDGVQYRTTPDDLVEIDQARFDAVIANPDPAKIRSHDDEGLPILIDPPPPSMDELILASTYTRDGLLVMAAVKIAPLQDAVDIDEATAEESALLNAWKKYRVELNRIQMQAGYPATIVWPVTPD